MTLLHRLASVLRWLVHRDRRRTGLDDELRTFVEMSAAEKMRDGVPPAEARRLALLELGGIETSQGTCSDPSTRRVARRDRTRRAVCVAACSSAIPPSRIIVVLTLALGIGANAAIFSLIDALMLRWLPVPESAGTGPGHVPAGPSAKDSPDASFSYAIVRALAEQHEIFTGVAGFSGLSFEVGSPGSVARVPGAVVTGDFYETLGLNPVVGRLLAREDDEPGVPLAAVISYGYWERQLARSPGVVGQTILINGVPVTIVGVSPRGFVGANVGSIADITMAVAALPQVAPSAAPLLGPGNFWLRVLARPNADVSIPEATARLNAVWPRMCRSGDSPALAGRAPEGDGRLRVPIEPPVAPGGRTSGKFISSRSSC